MVVDALVSSRSKDLLHWQCLNCVEEVQSLKSRFSVCIFGWVPGVADRAAHLVCRRARDCGWL